MARRAAQGNAPPRRMGGQGLWVGFGQVIIDGTLTMTPLYYAVDLVQIAFVASICCRIFFMRVANPVPCASISSAFQPPPMPNRKRPPLIWSIEATDFAVWMVSRWITRQIPVASFKVL